MALRLKFYVNYSLFSYLHRHVLSNQFDPNSSQFVPMLVSLPNFYMPCCHMWHVHKYAIMHVS